MEEIAAYVLGKITSDDPIQRAVVVGIVTWVAVQYVVRPWVADDRWYTPASIGIAVALNMASSYVTDQMYAIAALYGAIVGLAAAGGVNGWKRFRR
jgi:hypothetical protein